MADETTRVQFQEEPIDFAIDGTASIEKGVLLRLVSPRKVYPIVASGDIVAGISHREHVASSGKTRLSVNRKGVFRMSAGGTISAGDPLMASGTTSRVMPI